MRNLLKAAIYFAVSLILLLTLQGVFQKYRSMLEVLFVLWLLDGYLWTQSRHRINRMALGLSLAIRFLYWLPFALILLGTLVGHFVHFDKWNLFLRTEILNIILIGYVVKFPPMVSRIVTDLFRIIHPLPARQRSFAEKQPSGPGWLMITGWALGILLGLFLLAGHIFWRDRYTERKETLVLQDLPPSFEGLRIVQISDLHLGSWLCKEDLEKAVESVNSLRPDLVFVTGDLANFSTLDVLPYRNILKRINARRGIFAVYGNHDYSDYYKLPGTLWMVYMEEYQKLFRDLGWHLLLNQHYVLTEGTDSLAILGVENWGLAKRFQKLADLDEAEGSTRTIPVKLLLSHDPSYWEHIVTKRYPEIDVTFSGHTHGGQIGIESGNLRFSLVSGLEHCWAGWYDYPQPGGKKQLLYVNRGLGTIGYDGRIGIPAEITLFILTRGNQ